jgi:hypothetical protein
MVQSRIQRLSRVATRRLPLSLTMLRKIVWVGVGVAAFLVASVGVNLAGMVVSALMPGASPDKEGKMDSSPEEKAKAEWLKQMGESQKTQPATQSTEALEKPKEPENTPEESQTEPQPVEPERSALLPVAPPTPPRAATGPGDFDAPRYPSAPPAPQVGPGNL